MYQSKKKKKKGEEEKKHLVSLCLSPPSVSLRHHVNDPLADCLMH